MKVVNITGEQGSGKSTVAVGFYDNRCHRLGNDGGLKIDACADPYFWRRTYPGREFHTVVVDNLKGKSIDADLLIAHLGDRMRPGGVIVLVRNP